MKQENKIAEALYEILTGLSGERDIQHTQWEKQAKRYLKNLLKDKNISLSNNAIRIESEKNGRVLKEINIR